MNTKINFFLIAGEPSGDLYGSQLISYLRKAKPHSHFEGIGGPKMRKLGFEALIPSESLEMMGFGEVFLSLPRLFFYIRRSVTHIIKTQPAAVIFIDFPDFNMHIAKKLRAKGYKGKLIHFICPSVWAWRSSRIKQLANTLDLLLSIFPFEPSYFSKTSLHVEYIGNPLSQTITEWKSKHSNLKADLNYISLFPGSRLSEVRRNLPTQLATAERLVNTHPHLNFAISIAKEDLHLMIYDHLQNGSPLLREKTHLFPPHQTYQLMAQTQLALATSGTVTLELALFSVPTVMLYLLTRFNYIIARYIVKLQLPHYCLTNILAKETLFPEFIHTQATPEVLSQAMDSLLFSSEKRSSCLLGCSKLQQLLETSDSLRKAAHMILEKVSQ